MLIINTYFDSCNIDATSGANALIVNDSRFRGSKVVPINEVIEDSYSSATRRSDSSSME